MEGGKEGRGVKWHREGPLPPRKHADIPERATNPDDFQKYVLSRTVF
jgi:hypothetical protein